VPTVIGLEAIDDSAREVPGIVVYGSKQERNQRVRLMESRSNRLWSAESTRGGAESAARRSKRRAAKPEAQAGRLRRPHSPASSLRQRRRGGQPLLRWEKTMRWQVLLLRCGSKGGGSRRGAGGGQGGRGATTPLLLRVCVLSSVLW